MSNVLRTKKLPQKEYIDVEVTSGMTGETHKGRFLWRRRRLEDIGLIAAAESQLTGGNKIVEQTMAFHIMAIAELSVVVEDYPDWWEEVKELADLGVIVAVYHRYLDWLNAPFRRPKEAGDRPDKPSAEKVEGSTEG